jgi:hypothetical protein
MMTALSLRTNLSSRITTVALIASLLLPPLAVAIPSCEAEELPSAPTPKLRLEGTLASLNVAPSKHDLGPGQEPAPPAPALRIVILEGEDVSNNIKERTAREPIVQVEDENHKPVAGAAVVFTVSTQSGHAGASFLNGAKSFTGQTDANGQIHAQGFHPNGHAGQFHVNVTASKGQLTAHTSIAQTNVAAASSAATTSTLPSFVATHVVLVSAVVGGAVVGGVVTSVVVTQNNPGTVIVPGTGTVGAPPQLAPGVRSGGHR